jgi:predicted MPP superfamily phosphohydrolase
LKKKSKTKLASLSDLHLMKHQQLKRAQKIYSWRGNKRGMLPILLESLIKLDFNYLVFAGTNYSFAQVSQLSSTTAKQRSLRMIYKMFIIG